MKVRRQKYTFFRKPEYLLLPFMGFAIIPGQAFSAGELEEAACATPTIYVEDGVIVGGPDNGDTYDGLLIGTNGDDVIKGTDGNDTVRAGHGNDTICGYAGNDTLRGGLGEDTIYGGADNDKLYGEFNDDHIYGGDGVDKIVGGDGSDYLFGEAGDDDMAGMAGDDVMSGGDDNDKVGGGPGDDVMNGDAGDDNLWGQNGDDKLSGDAGNDKVVGQRGFDLCSGEELIACEGPLGPEVPSDEFTWGVETLEGITFAGTMLDLSVAFEWSGDATPGVLSIQLVGADGISEFMENIYVVDSDANSDGYVADLKFSIDADASDVLSGSIRYLVDGEAVGPALAYSISIADPDPGVIPVVLVDPSSDNMALTDTGIAYSRDELIVGVSFDDPDPVGVALSVAAAIGGGFIGSDDRLNMYQIRVLAEDLSQAVLEDLEVVAESIAGVEFASFNYIDIDIDAAIPDDTEWDSWNVATPGGNNWGLEWIDAPGAWDLSTGSADIKLGVIDFDNDETHGDLDDQVSRIERNFAGANGHGTHVAGTACAEGNNGTGTTGVAWDCNLLFYGGGSLATTAGKMATATEDDVRVVNISLNYIENGNCTIDETLLEGAAANANDVLGQAVVYGELIDKDVLWVLAAGNDCGRESIRSITAMFPPTALPVLTLTARD